MKYYPNTVRKVILAMCDAFSNVSYPDYVNNKDLVVPIHYTSVERFLAFWNQYTDQRKKYNIHLPVMSMDLESIEQNGDELQNDQVNFISCDLQQWLKNPNIVDLNFTLSIWCRQDNEAIMWNIIEQILAKFNNTKNYPFTALKFNDGSSINYELPIMLNSVNKNFAKFDIEKTAKMGIKSTLSFSVHDVKIFSTLLTDPKIINTIDITFENEFNQQWAKINIFENTSGDVETTIEDPV